jgi:predicted RNA binding protein YcfA (HicA-like mRNA interferase family)
VPKLPILSGGALVKLLKKAGFEEVGQRGSHVTLRKGEYKTVVPLHGELAPGTLVGILKQCGLRRDDLMALLGK